ncbi:MAG: hypothetical protein ACREAK_10080 [Nitrosarchaeum sp.]
MKKSWGLILVIVSFFIFLISLEEAYACSCSNTNLYNAVNYADNVFLGTVEKIETTGVSNEISIHTMRFWKGNENETMKVQTASDEGRCGFPFKEKQNYLIFATQTGDGNLATELCSYTRNEIYASGEIFLLDNNLVFLSIGSFWVMLFISWIIQTFYDFFIPILVIVGLGIYYLILFRKKIFSRKS